ncbi:hypothetical protein EYF80_045455 [Liparis tanakae]|uniref:Uncharacterized protein n=1 Tax=Liparis tanakae TaxID=230148 RepID=A0A4Z2FU80_9TELE|nr:hypothetical protein EYF80_045455 [Liparis tanakae]
MSSEQGFRVTAVVTDSKTSSDGEVTISAERFESWEKGGNKNIDLCRSNVVNEDKARRGGSCRNEKRKTRKEEEEDRDDREMISNGMERRGIPHSFMSTADGRDSTQRNLCLSPTGREQTHRGLLRPLISSSYAAPVRLRRPDETLGRFFFTPAKNTPTAIFCKSAD